MGYQVRVEFSDGKVWTTKRTYKTKAGADREATRTRNSGIGKHARSVKVVRV